MAITTLQMPTTLDDSVLEWQQDLLVAGNSMSGGPGMGGLPGWLGGVGMATSNSMLNAYQGMVQQGLQAQGIANQAAQNQSGLLNSQAVTAAQNLQNLQGAGVYTGTAIPTTLTAAPGSIYTTGGTTYINTGGTHWSPLQMPPQPQHVFLPTGPYLRMQFHNILDNIEDSGRVKTPYSDRAIKVRDRRRFDEETGKVDLVGFVDILLANGCSRDTIERHIADTEARLGITFVEQD